MRIVVALGGNALLTRGERPDDDVQRHHVEVAVSALAQLAADHELVITHGNGPQVGVLAIESATDRALSHPYPLDSLGAETQGLIGYWLAQELRNQLPGRDAVAVVTQTLVDRHDPAFERPTKFVGPVYDAGESARVAAQRGWVVAADGDGWRRVVASPEPLEIIEIGTIRRLVESGVVVVCAGGGGIPVVRAGDSQLAGVEAVIDKDLTSALLAAQLDADALLLLTDVDGVFRHFGTSDAALVREATVGDLRDAGFPPGSMGPKVEAACRFVERTGGVAAIGPLGDAAAILSGRRGSHVIAG
jgi:carbamate kinase